MKNLLTATLAVAIALAPASAFAQGVITYQQSYVTGSKPGPGKYKVVKIKKAKAVHHKHSHTVAKASPGPGKVAKVATVAKVKKTKAVHHKRPYKVAKAPHYATHSSYYRPGHHHHWHGRQHWLLPALVGRVLGLGLFHYWH
jgi:hypothetical protein